MSKRALPLCLAAIFVALLTVGSWIAVPAGVPFTLQTFVLYLALLLLPPSYAFAAVAVYLLLGAVGVPVFAGFQGGFSVLLGPPGGFLWGFLLVALLHVIVRPRSQKSRLICLIVATVLCYAVGAVWYAVYFGWSLNSLLTALLTTVLPFILPDAVKLIVAWQLSRRLKPHLPQ